MKVVPVPHRGGSLRALAAAVANAVQGGRLACALLFLIALSFAVPCGAQAFKVRGLVQWQDAAGRFHPARGVRVEVSNPHAPDAWWGFTDDRGVYRARLASRPKRIVATVRSWSSVAVVHDSLRDAPYEKRFQRDVAVKENDVSFDLEAPARAPLSRALSIVAAMTHGHEHAVERNALRLLPQVDVIFPDRKAAYTGKPGVKCTRLPLRPNADELILADTLCSIRLRDHDYAEWDVILHEYGHHVARHLKLSGRWAGVTIHGFAQCMGTYYDSAAVSAAWAEGWPTYFAYAVQAEPAVTLLGVAGTGDAVYTDSVPPGGPHILYRLDAYEGPFRGDDNEGTIARILYDLADVADTGGYDAVALGDAGIWKLLPQRQDTTEIRDVLAAALEGVDRADSLRIIRIVAQHRIGPVVTGPAATGGVPNAAPEFRWKWEKADCHWKETLLQIVFTDRDGQVIGAPMLTGQEFRPDPSLWQRVRDAPRPVRWLVYGNSSLKRLQTEPYILLMGQF
jgi:hypothetical protein